MLKHWVKWNTLKWKESDAKWFVGWGVNNEFKTRCQLQL